jgi:hypothetical protein
MCILPVSSSGGRKENGQEVFGMLVLLGRRVQWLPLRKKQGQVLAVPLSRWV